MFPTHQKEYNSNSRRITSLLRGGDVVCELSGKSYWHLHFEIGGTKLTSLIKRECWDDSQNSFLPEFEISLLGFGALLLILSLSRSLHSSPDGAARAMNLGYRSCAFHTTSEINFKRVVSFLEGRQILWNSLHINIGSNLNWITSMPLSCVLSITNKIISKKLNSVFK